MTKKLSGLLSIIESCSACQTKVAVGGTKDSQITFWSKASKIITTALQGSWSGSVCGGDFTICENICAGDPYDG